MSTSQRLSPRREKMFGEGRLVPLDRKAKVSIQTLARALMRRTEKGKHYGVITAKFVAVFDALLWGFHNAATGRCFPSYERIAERADCDRCTVYNAIRALERAGSSPGCIGSSACASGAWTCSARRGTGRGWSGLRTSTPSWTRKLLSLSLRLEPRTNYLFFLRCPPNWTLPTPYIRP